MKWIVYNILFLAVYPFLLPGFLVRMLKRGGYAARMGDRFALYPDAVRAQFAFSPFHDYRPSEFVWIHAVSVGEVQVAGQLMRAWRAVEPDVRFCFSTTSSTGWKMAEKEVRDEDVLIYNPLDFPTFVKAAFRTIRPRAVILTESEIWPNFIRTAAKCRVPLFLINARVSDRSAPRYRAARFFFGDIFRAFTRIFAQSDLDADRIRATGTKGNVEVTGSFKFDVARRNPAKEAELGRWLGAGRILLGGSTWPGEDEVLLSIYRKLRADQSTADIRLVIAPRHFEKADAVEANIRAAGFPCVRRSRGDRAAPGGVFLADTTGELMGLYGLADVVFVGKSLCAHGSQNMIEPCLCGKPTFVGPYTENFRPVMADLLAARALVQVKDADELADGIAKAFKAPDDLGARAKAAVENRCGVVAKCVDEIRRALKVFAIGLGVAAIFFAGCSREEKVVPEAPLAKPVEEAIGQIVSLVAPRGVKPTIRELDVAEMTAADFRREIDAMKTDRLTVWMPGETRWLLVGWNGTNRVSLAQAMETQAVDTETAASLPELFASYVGAREDILPAFTSKLTGKVLPEWFVTREIPGMDWLDASGVDADILHPAESEIHSMQVVRRMVLKGGMIARTANGKKDEEAAAAEWAKAYLRNPHDSMLLERLDRLNRNAQGFLTVGKVLQAMKCFETIILINPKNAAAVHNFGLCLQKIGRKDMAEKVLKRAEVLER